MLILLLPFNIVPLWIKFGVYFIQVQTKFKITISQASELKANERKERKKEWFFCPNFFLKKVSMVIDECMKSQAFLKNKILFLNFNEIWDVHAAYSLTFIKK